jgi:hypothetical protein
MCAHQLARPRSVAPLDCRVDVAMGLQYALRNHWRVVLDLRLAQ